MSRLCFRCWLPQGECTSHDAWKLARMAMQKHHSSLPKLEMHYCNASKPNEVQLCLTKSPLEFGAKCLLILNKCSEFRTVLNVSDIYHYHQQPQAPWTLLFRLSLSAIAAPPARPAQRPAASQASQETKLGGDLASGIQFWTTDVYKSCNKKNQCRFRCQW